MKNLFNLQLFADEDMVDAADFGFTEEDVKDFIPKEEVPAESEIKEPAETTEEPSETAPDSDENRPL